MKQKGADMLQKIVQTKITLKRDFKPPITLLQALRQAARPTDSVLAIAWERENGYVSRYDLPLPARAEDLPEVVQLAERIVKFLLWSSGGWRLVLAGPRKLCQSIKQQYAAHGARAFDVTFMEGVYGRPFGRASGQLAASEFETLRANRVEIWCDATNRRSAAVAERAGFTLEGRLRNHDLNNAGEPCDELVFSVIPEQ